MRRVPFLLFAFSGIFLAHTPSAYSDPPLTVEAVPMPKGCASPKCDAGCTTGASVQRIRVELSQPEVIIQQANCAAPPCCGLLRCCHWLKHHQQTPMMMPVQQGVMPYAVAPAASYGVMPQAVQPMSFGVQPMSFGVQPMSYGVQPSMSFGVQPMSFGVQPSMSFGVQPMSFGVQPMTYGVMPNNAQGALPSAQGTPPAKEDINDTLKKINQNLQDLIKVVDRHTDYIIDHKGRIDVLEKRADNVEKFLTDKLNALPPLKDSQFKPLPSK